MADDNWDLHAVVRGCATTSSTTTTTTTTTSDSYTPSIFQALDDHRFRFFADPFEEAKTSSVEDLNDLFKPFFPKISFQKQQPPQIKPFSSPPFSVLHGFQDLSSPLLPPPPPQQRQHHQSQHQKQSASTHTTSSRSRKRKNQMKRVCEVPAEGLSSDTWSWRKYGQKPIKGSPYPRGYYRCSTSKGCLARKQVERSRSDPGTFIVTYTAEHNHPMPTHRNSLAGTTRQKTTAGGGSGETHQPTCSSPVSPASVSPAIEKMVEDEDDDEFDVSDTVVGDDFFEGLEELTETFAGDRFSDQFPGSLAYPWVAKNATTTAGGDG
ncbi:hypothetical protein ACSBR1_016894 [Camellia fascicularis]